MTKFATLFLWAVLIVLGMQSAEAGGEKVQVRTPKGAFDYQTNSMNDWNLMVTNTGIIGRDVQGMRNGGIYPKDSKNTYIFGGGLWFGTKKSLNGVPTKVAVVTYNPASGNSMFVPGDAQFFEDCALRLPHLPDIQRNKIYFSTDFANDGSSLSGDDAHWCIWDEKDGATAGKKGYVGTYEPNLTLRNAGSHSKGPAVLSDEDVIIATNDFDVANFSGTDTVSRRSSGFPIGVDVIHRLYTWKSAERNNVIIVRAEVVNRSGADLEECWLGPMYDFDLINVEAAADSGASNDYQRYYNEDPALQMAFVWTGEQFDETSHGYVGMMVLETPATDAEGNLRKDKTVFADAEQLGLKSYRDWTLNQDADEPAERYDLMSSVQMDEPTGEGDHRMLLATGPFRLKNGETAAIVYAIIGEKSPKSRPVTGTVENVEPLVSKARDVKAFYTQTFQSERKRDEEFPESTPAKKEQIQAEGYRFDITGSDESMLGGFRNFRFMPADTAALSSLLGHEIEARFFPSWTSHRVGANPFPTLIMERRIEFWDLSDDNYLGAVYTRFEPEPCHPTIKGLFSLSSDVAFCNKLGASGNVIRSGSYSTAAQCYEPMGIAGAFHFSCEYDVAQQPGNYRLDEVVGIQRTGNSSTVFGRVIQPSPYFIFADTSGFKSNGPAQFEIIFREGGEEEIEVTNFLTETSGVKEKWTVSYLNIEVRNTLEVVAGSSTVRYANPLEPYQHSRNREADRTEVPENMYSFHAYPWLNPATGDGLVARRKKVAPSTAMLHGRYYLTAQKDGNTLKFSHAMHIGGAELTMSYSNIAGRSAADVFGEGTDSGEDFKAGDRITVPFSGGAFGLPLSGATVRARVVRGATSATEEESSAELLVSPNPVAQGSVNIRLPLQFVGNIEILAVDVLGNIAMRKFIIGNESNRYNGEFSLDVSELTSGAYTLQAKDGIGKTARLPLIIGK